MVSLTHGGASMDKLNKQDLARLIGSLEAYAKIAKPENQWMPQTVFALLDELERAAERNVAFGAELEQYRKDALYKKAVEKITVDDAGGMGKTIRWIIDQYVDQLCKEGGANG